MKDTENKNTSCGSKTWVAGKTEPISPRVAASLGEPTVTRDLKHQDGRHDDGIPEVYFAFRSCAEPEKLTAIRRRPVVGDGAFAVLT